jgi:hypothetical protein
MLRARIATFEKQDRGDVAAALLVTLVASMSLAVALLIYTPLR